MATGSPRPPHLTAAAVIRNSGSGSGKSGFSGNFFFAFFCFYGPLGTSGSTPDGPEPPNPDPDPGNPVFSNIRFFSFFAFLSLEPLQYGCLWTRLDPTRSLVPVPRYCVLFLVLLFQYLAVLFGTFRVVSLVRVFSLVRVVSLVRVFILPS